MSSLNTRLTALLHIRVFSCELRTRSADGRRQVEFVRGGIPGQGVLRVFLPGGSGQSRQLDTGLQSGRSVGWGNSKVCRFVIYSISVQ